MEERSQRDHFLSAKDPKPSFWCSLLWMLHLHVSNCRVRKFSLHNQDQLGLFSKFVGRLIDLLNLLVYDKFHNKVLESIFYEDF